jgi:hypothetical protein
MDEDRASIAEIRKALGGHCDWVTRRMLKRAGSSFPDRQQIARWAERPGHHLVTVGAWSTSVTVAPDGSIEIENPMVCGGLHRMVTDGDPAGIIVRSFTSEISHTLPDGTDIPVKEVRGWHLSNGVFHPRDEQAMFAATCTDARTGEALAPERGVRYADACPVVA